MEDKTIYRLIDNRRNGSGRGPDYYLTDASMAPMIMCIDEDIKEALTFTDRNEARRIAKLCCEHFDVIPREIHVGDVVEPWGKSETAEGRSMNGKRIIAIHELASPRDKHNIVKHEEPITSIDLAETIRNPDGHIFDLEGDRWCYSSQVERVYNLTEVESYDRFEAWVAKQRAKDAAARAG